MSEHSLPDDPASWPSDPFRLLGVTPGVSARELRKAYLRLIKSYKPEHSPLEFQKIRQAYDLALNLSRHFNPLSEPLEEPAEIKFQFEPEPQPQPQPLEPFETDSTTPSIDRPAPAIDPWNLACDGEPESAYRTLLELLERDQTSEEVFLQLYWLLALLPDLDPPRQPIDWLIRGLNRTGPRSGRLRELLRRELEADANLCLSDRLLPFFQRRSAPSLVLDLAAARWKAARSKQRWSMILADLQSLRSWMPELDTDTWARLLIAGSMNLAWADRPDSDHAIRFCREVEHLGHRQEDYGNELYQVEFIQIIKSGLDRLGGRAGATSGLFALLSCSWDDPGHELQVRLRSYVEQIAREPRVALEGIDRIQGVAPAVLGRLSSLMGGLDLEETRFQSPRDRAALAPVIDRFLNEHRWTVYRTLRLPLLRFCLQEAISPGEIARVLAETPQFVLTGKSPLANSIAEDRPLQHVYRASEMTWNGPAVA